MKLEYKSVAKAEVNYGNNQSIGVEVLVAAGRKLSDGEQLVIYHKVEEIYKMIRKNTVLVSDEYINEEIEEKDKLLACFQPYTIFAERIPNEYNTELGHPWYIITTHKGRIKIGWRKRVIYIDWSDASLLKDIDGDIIFKNEGTTYDHTYIHAWSYEKAKEYITKLLSE